MKCLGVGFETWPVFAEDGVTTARCPGCRRVVRADRRIPVPLYTDRVFVIPEHEYIPRKVLT